MKDKLAKLFEIIDGANTPVEEVSEDNWLKAQVAINYLTSEDKIVQEVVDKLQKRSEVGIKKYGTTLEENNSDDFLNHLQEELMDAILYIQKLKSK